MNIQEKPLSKLDCVHLLPSLLPKSYPREMTGVGSSGRATDFGSGSPEFESYSGVKIFLRLFHSENQLPKVSAKVLLTIQTLSSSLRS